MTTTTAAAKTRTTQFSYINALAEKSVGQLGNLIFGYLKTIEFFDILHSSLPLANLK